MDQKAQKFARILQPTTFKKSKFKKNLENQQDSNKIFFNEKE